MKKKSQKNYSTPSCIYGLGLIGAAIYFISQATGFWMGVLGLLKAFIWPLYFVLESFKYLGV